MNKKVLLVAGIMVFVILVVFKPFCPRPCPQYAPPPPDFCPEGKIIQQKDWLCGCPLPPKCESSNTKPDIQEKARENLSKVKVAVQYRWVTDWQNRRIGRSLEDVIKMFKETEADFIFQGWLTQWPLPERCSELPDNLENKCELEGYSYEYLKDAVSQIKREMPDVIFSGGVQAEYIYPGDIPGKNYEEQRNEAWSMSLNPEKWGINFSRRDMQCYWAKRWGFIDKEMQCPSEEELKRKMLYYFPDLTNPEFQKIFLNKIYRQIDAGVDAIWIDMLYVQPIILKQLTGDENHPAVRESYEAIWNIVNKIHNYGSKHGKNIYVISWVVIHRGNKIIELVPPERCNIDAAMTTPLPEEILSTDKEGNRIVGGFDENAWNEVVTTIKEKYNIPIFARIDYGGIGRTPLSVFSQELTRDEAREFLRKADAFFSSKGIIFIYPLHGGDMGPSGKVVKLSYGKFNWYDALAPEFDTYETIKELAQNKTQSKNDIKVWRARNSTLRSGAIALGQHVDM